MNNSLPRKLLERAETNGDEIALRHKKLGIWQEYSWQDYAEAARLFGLGLVDLGVRAGDKVAIHANNRPEWLFSDIGAQGIGAITVGIYPTSPAKEVHYLLEHSESKLIVVEDEEQLDKTLEVWHLLEHLIAIVVVDTRGVKALEDPRVFSFEQVLAKGRQYPASDFKKSVGKLEDEEVASIVYTSGTTGPPKGSMLTHANFHSASLDYEVAFSLNSSDDVLSYLPLCHIAERSISVVCPIQSGFTANFGEGGEAFVNDLREVQPTFFLGVPRVWERMLTGVQIRMRDATWFKRANYKLWTSFGKRIASKRMNGSLGFTDRLIDGLATLMLFRTLKQRLGMGRCENAISGAAPISPRILEWFWAIGVEVREAYGQTENCAQATINPAKGVKLGTVGLPTNSAEISIAPDGEILTRGGGTFAGYYKDPTSTQAAINKDGWLHTGDIGNLDEDGFLSITDRKKDIIITSGGKNISPSEIENSLRVSPYLREVIVLGDKRKYLTALMEIDYQTVGDWATRQGISYTTFADLSGKKEVRSLIEEVVTTANQDLAQVETIKKFSLLSVQLDQEDGQLTATQKVKRVAITSQFNDQIEQMYQ